MVLAKAYGGMRLESVGSDVNPLEDEDTVENTTFTAPLPLSDLASPESRSDLKSRASRGELKSHTCRTDLKFKPSQTNLKPLTSQVQSSRGEICASQPAPASSEDQDMQFRFVVQDRPVVVGLGLAAWRAQCPEMLESGQVVFQGVISAQQLIVSFSRCPRQTMISSSHSLRSPRQPSIHILQSTYFAWSCTTGRMSVHAIYCSTYDFQVARRRGLSSRNMFSR